MFVNFTVFSINFYNFKLPNNNFKLPKKLAVACLSYQSKISLLTDFWQIELVCNEVFLWSWTFAIRMLQLRLLVSKLYLFNLRCIAIKAVSIWSVFFFDLLPIEFWDWIVGKFELMQLGLFNIQIESVNLGCLAI